jgi:hypothetical protein
MLENRRNGGYDRGGVPAGTQCHRCGYDLRLLNVSGVCPECGVRIRESLRRSRLNRLRRRIRGWSWVDTILFCPLFVCSGGLWYRALTLGRPQIGYQEYRPIVLSAAICFTYLCVRYRPICAYGIRGRCVRGSLLILLFFLWAILFRAWSFDRYFPRW